jgi:hypothetical protein
VVYEDALDGVSRKRYPLPLPYPVLKYPHRVIEMQAIAATLIENFEFGLPPQNDKTKIRRKPTGLMVPMADGYLGVWMGLRVKSLN